MCVWFSVGLHLGLTVLFDPIEELVPHIEEVLGVNEAVLLIDRMFIIPFIPYQEQYDLI